MKIINEVIQHYQAEPIDMFNVIPLINLSAFSEGEHIIEYQLPDESSVEITYRMESNARQDLSSQNDTWIGYTKISFIECFGYAADGSYLQVKNVQYFEDTLNELLNN